MQVRLDEPTNHEHVPVNEFTSMQLAGAIGVDIPEIRLVEIDKLDRLPEINCLTSLSPMASRALTD